MIILILAAIAAWGWTVWLTVQFWKSGSGGGVFFMLFFHGCGLMVIGQALNGH